MDFRDPWYLKSDGNQPAANEFLTNLPSPYYPRGAEGASSGGVLLNQPTDDPSLPYYIIRVPQSNTFGTTTSWFYDFEASGATLGSGVNEYEKKIRFNSLGAVVKANYKGSLATSLSTALKNNGQRKIVRANDGWQYFTYHSAGKLWVEEYNPGINQWSLLDLGAANLANAQYPSISLTGNSTVPCYIVYQRPVDSNVKVEILTDIGTQLEVATVNAAEVTNPVIAVASDGKVLVVWEQKQSATKGLYYRYGAITQSTITWYNTPAVFLGTDVNSTLPTLAVENAPRGSTWYFHLAWQHGAHIKYNTIFSPPDNTIHRYPIIPADISTSSGYTTNYSPSIISFDQGARLTWVGKRWQQEDPTLALEKSAATGEWLYHTLFTDPSDPSYFWNWGTLVTSVNINKATTGTDDNSYVIGWTENSGAQARYIRSTSFTNPSTFVNSASNPVTGNGDLHVTNGNAFSSMFGYFLQSGAPNKFTQSTNLSGSANKQQASPIFSGREGIVRRDSAQFYFALGDIIVNGEPVQFISVPDTVHCDSLDVVNTYLTSENFTLTDDAQFVYSVMYGITDSAAAVNALQNGTTVRFRVELVDAASGQVIGIHDEVEYNADNVFQYDNIGYEVNTAGIGTRTVRLRLRVLADAESHFSISDRYDEQEVLGKQSAKRTSIGFKGSYVVTEYALDQNYPNPFNPVTTISYALPKDGLATIKIFDALGREVKTLVNEFKQPGRYTAEFDASRLASGVYIYKIISGDFSAVKKMLLIK